MRKLKVGLVGLGEVAQVIHLPVLEQLADHYEVTAICDVAPGLLEAVGNRYGIPARYTEAEELADHPELDAVFVLNSNEYHAECALAAIRAGKHVLIEKPMCMTVREADEIIAAKNQAGVQVMVGYMRRFAPAYELAVHAVREMKDITYARVRDIIGPNSFFVGQSSKVLRYEPPASMKEERAARNRALVAEAIGEQPEQIVSVYNLLLGLSSHDLSAMREMLGLPLGVISAKSWLGGRFYSVQFDYGSYVALFETGVDRQGRFDACIEVMNATQTVKVDYDTPYIRHLPVTLTVCRTEGETYSEQVTRPTYRDPYTLELLYFHRVVTDGLRPKTSAEDAREDLVLFRGIVQAMVR